MISLEQFTGYLSVHKMPLFCLGHFSVRQECSISCAACCQLKSQRPDILFDKHLRVAVTSITNFDLTDIQWMQASLPIKHGGLGIRRMSSLANPAFLVSVASTLSLQDHILALSPCSTDPFLDSCLSYLSTSAGPLLAPLPGKQSFLDKLGLQNGRAFIEDSFAKPSQKARFLALVAPHSGDWLLALPAANCGLRLGDEAVRVAVGMRLGLPLCAPHSCPCGGQVDAQDLHAMVCKKAPGRIARHQVLDDIIWRSLGSASIPATKEPSELVRQDGKRPDGLTLIPWQGGKSLAWDVTVVSTLARSYVDMAATFVGMVAELAAERKLIKCSNLQTNLIFQPIAV